MPLAFAVLSLAVGVKQAQDTKKTAREQAAIRKKQVAAQARVKFITQQRAARKKIAEAQAASAASGAIGSLTQGDITAKSTMLAANQDIIGAEAATQATQIDLSTQQTVDTANAQIGQSVGTFAAQTLTPTGTDQKNMFERAIE
jgi:hypothetical protein